MFCTRGVKYEGILSKELGISDEYVERSASVRLLSENNVKEFGISDRVLEFVQVWCVFNM